MKLVNLEGIFSKYQIYNTIRKNIYFLIEIISLGGKDYVKFSKITKNLILCRSKKTRNLSLLVPKSQFSLFFVVE